MHIAIWHGYQPGRDTASSLRDRMRVCSGRPAVRAHRKRDRQRFARLKRAGSLRPETAVHHAQRWDRLRYADRGAPSCPCRDGRSQRSRPRQWPFAAVRVAPQRWRPLREERSSHAPWPTRSHVRIPAERHSVGPPRARCRRRPYCRSNGMQRVDSPFSRTASITPGSQTHTSCSASALARAPTS